MERYIGLDAHGQSCTFGVIGPSGRKIRHDVVETNGGALVRHVKRSSKKRGGALELDGVVLYGPTASAETVVVAQ